MLHETVSDRETICCRDLNRTFKVGQTDVLLQQQKKKETNS